MKKFKKLLVASVFFTSLVGPQLVIAEGVFVLKAEQAIFATQKALALGQQVSAQLKPQVVRFDAMGGQLQALQQRLEADKELMSDDEVLQMKTQIQNLNMEYQQLQQYLSNAKLQAEQNFLTSMRPALDKVLGQFIKDNAPALIINGNSVIYSVQSVDITPTVVELLNLEP
ncbi:MAG: OmpH family outer membrane protein [Oceanospirillaceae bacterium]|nr:OmpH family outer membrane protein [Oceanospirillaceae bacterium]